MPPNLIPKSRAISEAIGGTCDKLFFLLHWNTEKKKTHNTGFLWPFENNSTMSMSTMSMSVAHHVHVHHVHIHRYGRLKSKFLCVRISHCIYRFCTIELTNTRNTWSLQAVFGKRPRFQEKWYFWPFVEFVADFCYFRQFLQISNISDNLWTRGGRKLCDQCFTFLKIFKIIFYSPCHHHHHPNSWELSNIQKKESLLTSILRTLTDFKLQSSVWFLWFFLGKNINVKKKRAGCGMA